MNSKVSYIEPGACNGPIYVMTKQQKRFLLFLAVCMAWASIGNIYYHDPHACMDTDGEFENTLIYCEYFTWCIQIYALYAFPFVVVLFVGYGVNTANMLQ